MTSSLPNYLLTNRKRLALSQEEVAFLLGATGENKGVKVCRDERFTREPSLRMALAYEAIYGKPARELFAGLHEEIEREVAARAKILLHRKDREPDEASVRKRKTLADLSGRQPGESVNHSPS